MYVFRDEINSRKLKRLSIIASSVALCLIALFLGVMINLTRIFSDTYHQVVESMVDGDAVIISRLVHTDLASIQSLAHFAAAGDFLDKFNALRLNGELFPLYAYIGYCDTDGQCRQVTHTGALASFSLSERSSTFREAIRGALSGGPSISNPFYSQYVKEYSLLFTAPVDSVRGYRQGTVFAVRALKDYSEILRDSRHDHSMRIYLVNSEGTLISSSRDDARIHEGENICTVFPSLTPLIDTLRLQGDASHIEGQVHHVMNGEQELTVHTRRLEVRDWSLLYVLDHDITFSNVHSKVVVMGALLSVFLIIILIVGIAAYVSLRRAALKQQNLVSHDQLTGALNFSRFFYELQHTDLREHTYALASFNIRDFRYINKFAGVTIGDLVLRTVVNVASGCHNMRLVCRTDSDHFYFLMEVKDIVEAQSTIRNIIRQMQMNFEFIKLSSPLVCYSALALSEPEDNAHSLIQKTQVAERHITKKFSHTVAVYDSALQQEEQRLKSHEQRMRIALESNEFKLYLMGQFDVASGKLIAAEVLVRWEMPDGTLVYPDQFISLFEQNGFSTELDLYMFDRACRRIRSWLDAGIEPIPLSVNQTRNLLVYPNYVDKLKESLERWNVPGKYLCVEMLEGEMATRLDQLNAVVSKLHELGIRMSLDDFGTGYSSLNVLAGMDLDEVKFDKQFLMVSDPEEKKRNKLILTQMMQIVHVFKMKAVVEGVEKEEDVAFLKTIGADFAQGYYYSRPIEAELFNERFIENGRENRVALAAR